MNILQLAFHTSPFSIVGKNDGGGMSVYVQQISKYLSENHNVTVVTGEKADSFTDKNLEFISLNIFEGNIYLPIIAKFDGAFLTLGFSITSFIWK